MFHRVLAGRSRDAAAVSSAYRDRGPGPCRAALLALFLEVHQRFALAVGGRRSTFRWARRKAGAKWSRGRPTSRPAPCTSATSPAQAGQHQIVVQGEVLAEGAGIALAAAAADQLPVDAAGVVHFGADDVQAAQLGHALAELDVRAAAGHVGRDGDLARQAGARRRSRPRRRCGWRSRSVLDARLVQQLGKVLRFVDRAGADQQRAGRRRAFGEISSTTAAHLASAVPNTRSGSRWRIAGRLVGIGHHVAAVDLAQLAGRTHRRAGHARQLLVAEEEVLDGDPRRLAGCHGHLDALLGLDGLVDAVAPLAPLGQPAGELVDDHDLAVADDVLAVEVVLALDHDRPLDVLVDVDHADGVHGRRLGQHADLLPALAGQLGLLLLVVVLVVVVLDELAG